MASYGDSLPLPATLPFTLGGGSFPQASVWYTTDAPSDTDPLWIDATSLVRSASTSRGRENELTDVDAGTATITLDNRDRTFDPAINSLIRPMNRWWIREQFTGETQSIFMGYADSYDQQWRPPNDAVAVVSCTDEFKVLALDKLPVMSPPRDTYNDVVAFDEPTNFWDFDDHNNLAGNPGPSWTNDLGYGTSFTSSGASGAILGESPAGWLAMQDTSVARIKTNNEAFDTQGLAAMTLEFWFKYTAAPGSNISWLLGRWNAANTVQNFKFTMNTTGTMSATVTNTVPTAHTVTSGVLTAATWCHLAATLDGSFLRLYVNGAEVASTAWTGVIVTSTTGDVSATEEPALSGAHASANHINVDKLAFYQGRGLDADRVLAHYTAGTARGFAGGVAADERIGQVLDVSESVAPRRLGVGVFDSFTAQFMTGQAPLDELRRAASGELSDGLLFISRSGEIVFLASDHRAGPPYNTVQATFDDDGTDLSYHDLEMDYSESFLFNDWNVTGQLMSAQNAHDDASIAAFFKRSRSVTDLPLYSEAHATIIADNLLSKYKDPHTRVLSINLSTAEPAVTEEIFQRDIGDRIRVFRTPPGGGARIDQTLFIQKISVDMNPSGPWRITWNVSPV